MKFNIKIDGKEVSPQEALSDLLHPAKLAQKVLQDRIGDLRCELHPLESHPTVTVKGDKAQLSGICCDAFRQTVLQAMQTNPSQSDQTNEKNQADQTNQTDQTQT